MSTCRVCKQPERDAALIKYGVRHYAHPRCALAKWGARFFLRLTPWQCTRFPYFVAREFGVQDALAERARQAVGVHA
jgi:hypothetical protein